MLCRDRTLILAPILLLTTFSLLPRRAIAATDEVQAAGGASQESLDALLEECRREVQRTRTSIEQHRSRGSAQVPEALLQENKLWTWFNFITARRNALVAKSSKLQRQLRDEQNELERFRRVGLETSSPNAFLELDATRNELAMARRASRALSAEISTAETLRDEVLAQFEAANSDRRQIAEDRPKASGGDGNLLAQQHAEAVLRCRILDNAVRLRNEELALLQIEAEIGTQRVAALAERASAMAQSVEFTQEQLESCWTVLDTLETKLSQQLERAQLRFQQQESATGGEAQSAAGDEIEILQHVLCELATVRDCWQRRFSLFNHTASEDSLDAWLGESEAAKLRIVSLARRVESRMAQRRNEIAAVARDSLLKTGGANQSPAAASAADLAEVEQLVALYGESLVLLQAGVRLHERFVEDLQAQLDPRSTSDYVHAAADLFDVVWDYELAAIDDQSITLGKIIKAVALIIAGFLLSRMISRVAGKRLFARLGPSHAGSSALQTLLFYALLTCFTLLSLDIVNVPLTVFAFFGGAAAIGVGFGSQNLLNNFISGLILLVERPIRVGDLVNVEGIDANIEKVGARSTRVRTSENLEILVPNSKFLENKVTNWTLSDTKIRTKVSVGVAYGSPVRRVVELLERAVSDHPQVIGEPAPIILFRDFGDNSLLFEAHFWIHMMRIMDGAIVESEIRIRVDDLFAEAGVTIAFPQRDVHLDVQSPIQVQLESTDHPAVAGTLRAA